MADTRSKTGKKGQEQIAAEELVPITLEQATPIGMEALVQYLLQNNKEQAEARKYDKEEAAEARKFDREEALRKEEAKEERAERRRKQDLIEAEERQEKREARQLILKQEAEKELREEKRKQKIEDEKRAFEQHQKMLDFQTEIGSKAEETRLAEFEKCRAKDKAMAGILAYKDSDDVEEYMEDAEKKLIASGIPEREWVAAMTPKLSGKIGSTWSDLKVEGATFKSMKEALLVSWGYTPKIAGDQFFNFKLENLKGMTPGHLWRRGIQLLRRVVAPRKLEAEAEFLIVKAWVWAVVPRKARILLDGRNVTNHSELTLALQDYLACEGENVEGQVAVFGKQHQGPEHSTNSSGANSDRRPVGNCFRCGKPGHKVANCWQKVDSGNGNESARPDSSKTIICFLCGVEGHKSPQCPKKGQQEETKPKEVLGQAKPVRRLRVVSPEGGSEETILEGFVNGRATDIVLDTGTTISVVPEDWVEEELKTGEEVSIAVFGSDELVILPVAKVLFKVKHLEWEEVVALAPAIEGQKTEVLYKWKLTSDIGFELVSLVREGGKEKDEAVGADEEVMAADRPVKTSESEPPVFDEFESETDEEEEEEENSFAADKPEVAMLADEVFEEFESKTVEEDERIDEKKPVVRKPVAGPVSIEQSEVVGPDKGGRAADRPVQSPESVPPAFAELGSDSEVEEDASLPAEVSEDEIDLVAEDEDLVEEVEDVMFCLKPKGRDDIEFEVPPVEKGSSHWNDLAEAVKSDVSLKKWRELVERKEEGFSWVERSEVVVILNEVGRLLGGKEVLERLLELAVPGYSAAAKAVWKLVSRASLGPVGFCWKWIFEYMEGIVRMSSVLPPWNAKLSPSVVEWTKEGLQAFNNTKVCIIDFCDLTVPSEEDVFVSHTDDCEAGAGDTLNMAGDVYEPGVEETTKLRAAPSFQLVGGDVGSNPTKKQEGARTCRPDAGNSLQVYQDRTYEL